ESDERNGNGDHMITAYAVHRPDGLWSVLVINRDPTRTYQTHVGFRVGNSSSNFAGQLDVFQYSSEQYALGGTAHDPHPVKSDGASHKVVRWQSPGEFPDNEPGAAYLTIPPYSLTVVRGRMSPLLIARN